MTVLRKRFARLVALLGGLACAVSGIAAENGQPSQAVRQLLVKYRTARLEPKRAAAVVQELTAAGPEGVAAIKEVLEKDLTRLEAAVPERPNTKLFDEKIDELRKTLAELRKAPDLSKQAIEKVGLPALDQLTELWKQREAVVGVHYQKLTKLAAQIQLLDALFRQLEEAWKGEASGGPLPVRDYLARAAALLAKATPHADEAVRRVLAENESLAAQLPADTVAGMKALNAMRIMCGLNPLLYDPKLCETATDHSRDMETKNFFDHSSPVEGKKSPWDRAKRFGTTASAENIYMGSNVTVDAIKAWFLSPGHHKNMLGEGHKRQGLGRSGKHWTQMFGG